MTQLYEAAFVSMLITALDVAIMLHGLESYHYISLASSNGDEVSFHNLTGVSREAFEEMHKYL